MSDKTTEKGTLPEPETEKATPRNPNFVYAKRGDQRNQFSKAEWDNLGSDKAGWELDIEKPKDHRPKKDEPKKDEDKK